MSDFYVGLPSHSSKNEFPENKTNSFKIRLPNPIHLEGNGWKVGMCSITMPDAHVMLPSFTDCEDKVTLAYTSNFKWAFVWRSFIQHRKCQRFSAT